MKRYYIVLTLIIFFGCNNVEVPENSKIVAKYVVLNEQISPLTKACAEDSPKQFTKMNSWDCSFKLEEYTFDVEKKLTLNDNGNMIKMAILPIEEYIDYTKYGISKDTTDYKKISGNDIIIKLSESRKTIVDYPDTLVIEKVFPNEKLIFVENTKIKGKRFIYQYK
jgi:hypothetical protein